MSAVTAPMVSPPRRTSSPRSAMRCTTRWPPTTASILLGEDVGNRGGVFRISAGWMDEFGPERVIDTPLAEVRHRRRRDRHVPARTPARRRDPVRRLHPPRVRSDRVRSRPHALPLERCLRMPPGDPRALRRRDPRRALSLPVDRGVLRACPRPEGGDALDPRRRGGAAAQRAPRPRPRAVPRAQEDLPSGQGAGT